MINHVYPGTDLHEIDLAYILEEIKRLQVNMSSFTSSNTLKFADPIQWNITTQYEPNTFVNDQDTGCMYISMKPVPAGVQITNTDYWAVLSNYEIAIEFVKNAITSIDESGNVYASQTINENDLVWYDDVLYSASTTINTGDPIIVGSNISLTTISDILTTLQGYIDAIYIDLNGKAPTDHAAASTAYGGGNSTKYGHVKVSDNISTSAGNAAQSVAASSKAVKDVYDITQTNAGNISNNTSDITAANNNANSRVLKAGDTMTGNLIFKETVIDKDVTPANDINGNTIVFQDKNEVTIGFMRIYQTSSGEIGIMIRSTEGSMPNDLRLLTDGTNRTVYVSDAASWKSALGFLTASDVAAKVFTGTSAVDVTDTGFTLSRAKLTIQGSIASLNLCITGNSPTTMTLAGVIVPTPYRPASSTDFAVGATSKYGRGTIDTSGNIRFQCNGSSASGTFVINVTYAI